MYLAISYFFLIILVAWKHGINIKVFTCFSAGLFLNWSSSPVFTLGGFMDGHTASKEAAEGQERGAPELIRHSKKRDKEKKQTAFVLHSK